MHGRAFLRLLIAHGLAYPLTMIVACAWIPLAILAEKARLLAAPDPNTLMNDVLGHLWPPALAAFLLEHLAAIPWAFAKTERNERRGRRAFWGVTTALFLAGVLGGGALWLWFWFRAT